MMNTRTRKCRHCAFRDDCSDRCPPLLGKCSVNELNRKLDRDAILHQIGKRIRSADGSIILRNSVTVSCDDFVGEFDKTITRISIPEGAGEACQEFDIGQGDTTRQLGEEDLVKIFNQL